MVKNVKSNYVILLFVVFGGFLVFGFSENVKGPAIPRMQADFGLNEAQLGVLLALNSLGYLVACSFTSALSARIGVKATGILAFGSMAVSGVLMYVSANYAALSASYFLMYIGNGMLEIGLAIMAARIFTKNTGTMMNLAHFFYGLSSTVAPLIAASMMGWHMGGGGELGWRGMYLIMLSLSLLPIIPSLLGKFPGEVHAKEDRVSLRVLSRDPIAWLIVAILSFGVVSELAVGSWLVNFLEKAYGWSSTDASGMLSVFFLFFMLARLFLGPVTDKIGYTLSVMIFSAFSGLCSLAAIAIGEPAAVLFAVAGVGISPIYPTVMAMIAKRYPKGTDTAITFTVTLMGIASFVGNLVIGYIIDFVRRIVAGQGGGDSQIVGLQAGYVFIAAMALLCSACCVLLYVILRRRGEVI
ncbi:major facilitator superfamily protein [Cohnella xylanilytica]|uniref:MFS transporter n=1 Tax=Cohnella xylanilytica TaxID=557555 RepID=A0A841UCZ7_9BACL|nr:MFS transporter [Cohnella xylanilytica]MBB6695801.1 MFS transporter [Cohnella xylanilytica]GIO15458.1 major facilitator superfamily protein [Cohnella xylanilytica]